MLHVSTYCMVIFGPYELIKQKYDRRIRFESEWDYSLIVSQGTLIKFGNCLKTILKYLFININQLDPLNFIISLFQASTCFEHMCSKHVEAWNKLIIKFSASSWLILRNKYIEMHGQQNIKILK